MQTLELVMGMMLGQDMDGLAEALYTLGGRHVQFGVTPAHYNIVETALLRTLGGALGDQWTDEVRKGWAAVFKFISKAMMSGAGTEPEIVKEGQHQKKGSESHKNKRCATMRLSLPESKASPSKSPDSSGRRIRSRPRTRRRKSDPPRLSPRARTKRKGHSSSKSTDDEVGDFHITEIIFENSTVLDVDCLRVRPFYDDWSCDSSLSSRGSFSSTRLDEAPQRPTRHWGEKDAAGELFTLTQSSSLPDITVIESNRRALAIKHKRSDSAPKLPRRRATEKDEDVLPLSLCNLQGHCSSGHITADTLDTTMNYDDENFRSAYWREETVQIVSTL